MTLLVVLDFLKAHWPKLSAVFAAIFCLTTIRGCNTNAKLKADLQACLDKPPVPVVIEGKAHQEVRIVYRDGSPCPDVTAVNDNQIHAEASAQSKPCPAPPSMALWASVGYLGTPYIGAGIQYKDIELDAKRSMDAWGGEIRYRALVW